MTDSKTAAPGFGGDAYPGQTPQFENDMDSRYMHDPAEFEPGSGQYQFFYGNGQLHVSPFHEHDELRGHAGVPHDHTGPVSVGYVSVDRGRANWQVSGNVALRGFARILKDYTKQVGWQWGGLTDVSGHPIDDSFAQKKSMILRDNLGGDDYEWVLQGRTAHIGTDAPVGAKQALTEAGYKVAEYPGGGNMNDRLDNYAPAGETYDLHNMGADKEEFDPRTQAEQPTGTFRCPSCSKVFNHWKQYIDHRREEDFPQDEPQDDGKFPEIDLDKTLPGGYHERRPIILPLASVHEAEAYDEYEDYAGFLGITDDTHRAYGAYRNGELVGIATLRNNNIDLLRGRSETVRTTLVRAAQVYNSDLVADGLDPRTAATTGFVRTSGMAYKWSAGSNPKDQLDRPLPFIYDVQDDKITVGFPGGRHADIPGKFTPGGIIEGDYNPGGQVTIHTMTNMPYSVRHLIELWYWSYPHLEVTGVELHDNAGNTTKLASARNAIDYLSKVLDASPRGGIFKVADNSLKVATLEDDKSVWLVGIDVKDKGTGLGTKVVDALHEYAAFSKKRFAVRNVKNTKFFDRFSYLVPTETGWDTKYESRLSKTDVGSYIKQLALTDPAVWNAYKALKRAGGEVYVVGGAVRDALLQKEPKDIDLMVTGVPTEQVDAVLSALPGRVDLTGKNFGVYRYRTRGKEVEIALPRTEKSTGDRRVHFDVDVDHNLPVEDDLRRRDFTVNSMAVNMDSGHLIDPYGGADDIEHRRLHTTHPASFAEDPTRLVRALVMAGRYGLHPDERTRHEIEENAHRLDLESPDAVQPILDKLFASHDPARAIRLAHETGLLKHIFPEVEHNWDFDQNNPHHNYKLGEHLVNVLENVSHQSSDPDLRVAALLHDVGKPASAWTNPETGFNHYYRGPEGQGDDHEVVGARMAEDRLRSLKWPTARIKRISHIINHHMWPAFSSTKGARKFLNRVGDEHADDLLTFRWADQHGKGQSPAELAARTSVDQQRGLVEQSRSKQEPTSTSALSVNGNDIIGLGVKAGPEVGAILRKLTDDVIEEPSLNDRNALLERAQEYRDALI